MDNQLDPLTLRISRERERTESAYRTNAFARAVLEAKLAALDAARLINGGLRGSIREYGMYEGDIAIYSPIAAQGGLNTVQAEAIAKVFEDFGLKASVYYRMD